MFALGRNGLHRRSAGAKVGSLSPVFRFRLMGASADVKAALAVLGLRSLPRSRADLARRVAAHHPASRAWSALHTAAYRKLWEALEPADAACPPMAA